jgi:cytoskeletal protein CcmA (bactofilin family)
VNKAKLAKEVDPVDPARTSSIDCYSHFNGLYETQQDLRIEGVAEGDIRCEGTLVVAEGSRVKANITASNVTIAGELEGEVTCRGLFQIMPSGQVEATVSARRLIVHEGGLYNGEFRMMGEEPAEAASTERAEATSEARSGEPSTEEPAPDSLLASDEWWAKLMGSDPAKKEGQAQSS